MQVTTPDYSDAMATAKQLSPLATWAWRIGTIAAGCFAIFVVRRFGGLGLIFGLAACLCFLIVSGVVGTRRELRRREAARAAAMRG